MCTLINSWARGKPVALTWQPTYGYIRFYSRILRFVWLCVFRPGVSRFIYFHYILCVCICALAFRVFGLSAFWVFGSSMKQIERSCPRGKRFSTFWLTHCGKCSKRLQMCPSYLLSLLRCSPSLFKILPQVLDNLEAFVEVKIELRQLNQLKYGLA